MSNLGEQEAHPQERAQENIREQIARQRARRALTEVELAQRSLALAAALLASVRGAARQTTRLQRIHGSVRREWSQVASLFDRPLDLDQATSSELTGATAQVAERMENATPDLKAVAVHRGAR